MSVDLDRLEFLISEGRRVDFYIEYAQMIIDSGGGLDDVRV